MSAIKERVDLAGEAVPAKPCCGVYVQQVNRIARINEQIQAWTQDNQPSSIRELRLALKRKLRMENWLAAHTHEPSLPPAAATPVAFEESPGD